ncbi:bifunctional DNA primase/polymerase [Streptomyces sp. NPDC047515]|uniref:bifunctional DNA primase/polymerase n=1 Tax=Streptomyces sp. NPDC047515 TaxID=3155380 RepID=UPI00340E5F7D
MTTAAAAADLTTRGLAVFPLPPGGRKPAASTRLSQCLTDPEQVRQLWRDGDNIGVSCRASGIVGLDLDLDVEGDGQAVLAELAARLGEPWPETLTVATPSGGRHLYFAAPVGCTIGSFSGGRTALGPGIDVRGPGLRSGGYLIGPGSVVGGVPYVIARDVPVQPLPQWIADRLNGTNPRLTSTACTTLRRSPTASTP